jgi:hypothetical protein
MVVDLEAFEDAPIGRRHRFRHPRLQASHLLGLPIEDMHHHHRSFRTQGVMGDRPAGAEGRLE